MTAGLSVLFDAMDSSSANQATKSNINCSRMNPESCMALFNSEWEASQHDRSHGYKNLWLMNLMLKTWPNEQ